MPVTPLTSREGGLRTKNKFTKEPSEKKPLFSIITVVYNGEATLQNTINSVVSQTYENVEYVIIDGNSNDKTLEIIKRNEEKIAYWKSEPDKGIYDGMNKGINAATGDYLLFLNSGDLLAENDTLEKIASKINYPDIIYSETYLADEQGKILGTRSELTTRKLPANKFLEWKDMRKGMLVCHQSFIVKKSIAPKYDTSYHCSADIDWVIRSLKNSSSVFHSRDIISKFLVGGYSTLKQKACLRERWKVSVHHFGFFSTLFFSIYIIFRAAAFRLKNIS